MFRTNVVVKNKEHAVCPVYVLSEFNKSGALCTFPITNYVTRGCRGVEYEEHYSLRCDGVQSGNVSTSGKKVFPYCASLFGYSSNLMIEVVCFSEVTN
jgi:hypothetical protein